MRRQLSVGQINLLHRQQPGVVGIAYFVVASRRGRGFRRPDAVQVLSRWALSLVAVVRLEALVMVPENVTSCHVFERAGFRQEGILRRYLDLGDRHADAVLFSAARRHCAGGRTDGLSAALLAAIADSSRVPVGGVGNDCAKRTDRPSVLRPRDVGGQQREQHGVGAPITQIVVPPQDALLAKPRPLKNMTRTSHSPA